MKLVASCAALAAAAMMFNASARAQQAATLTQVIAFPDRQATGIAVTADGRTFLSFPRWADDVDMSVAELKKDGTLAPYPDAAWNSWRNNGSVSAPDQHFVCVQAVTFDPKGFLWVVDPARPALGAQVKGGPKLVKIDLRSNRVVQTVPLGPDVAPEGSYPNDLRLNPTGTTAYLSDSGDRGAILVLDTGSGRVRRVLDGHPATQPEPVEVKPEGKPLKRSDGTAPRFAADGIAVSADGQFLYWQALTGKTLYRAPTRALDDASTPADRLASQVQKVAETFPADGLWTDKSNRLWLTSIEDDAVKLRGRDGQIRTVVKDARLRWPDSFAEGADGTMYFTTSHIQDMPWFKPDASIKTPSEVWKITPPR